MRVPYATTVVVRLAAELDGEDEEADVVVALAAVDV